MHSAGRRVVYLTILTLHHLTIRFVSCLSARLCTEPSLVEAVAFSEDGGMKWAGRKGWGMCWEWKTWNCN